ncbi:MAG: ABC transporter permease subunit [Pirellula sp.]
MNATKLQKFFVDNVILPAVGVGVCVMFWCFLSWMTWDEGAGASDFPSPISTWTDSAKYFASPFSHNEAEGFDGIGLEISRSLMLVGLGFGMAIMAAVPIGFLLGGSQRFASMFDPIFQVLRPISPLAWYPLAGLIVIAIRRYNKEIDATQLQCIFTIAMCSIWPTILNTAVGVRAIPNDYLNVAKVLRLSTQKLFTRILLPATVPYMFTGFRLSLGIAWLVIVAAEMLSGKSGIGAFVNNQYQSGTYGPMIAAVIAIGVVGFILDRCMNVLEKNAISILGFPSFLVRFVQGLRSQGTPSISSSTLSAMESSTHHRHKETSDAAA